MPENAPELDVEAIRARLDALAPIPAPWEAWDHEGETNIVADAGQYVAHIGKSTWPNTPLAADLIAHAPTDLRRLLDENARLNAEFADFREMAVLNTRAHNEALAARDRTVEALSARLTAKNAELDKVIREAAADKAKLDAKVADLEAQIEAGRRVEKGEPCPECGGTVSPWRDVWGKVGFHACTTCTWPLPGPDGTPRIAPEMPRPPAEEADAEYMVVIPSLCGNPTDYRMSYSSDRVRKSTREAAIAHGLEVEGHDDWLIAIVVGDKLTGLAWQHEDRDDAEEVEEAAAALGLTAAFAMPVPAAQERVSGPETAGTGSGRGTGVTEAQASDG